MSMASLSLPSAITYLCRLGMAFTDIAVLGRVSTDYLAGAAVGNMWMNITSCFCDRGVAAAFAVLAGQAYGAGNSRLVGLYLQQAFVLATLLSVPVMLLWWYSFPLLRVLGIAPEEARLAEEFARWSLPRMLPLNVYFILQRWMQVQQRVLPAMVINALFLGVNFGLNIALVHGIGTEKSLVYIPALGFKGSPIATAITQCGVCFVFLLYIILSGAHRGTWRGWRLRRALSAPRLRRMVLEQVVPLGLGACFEEWQLETISLMAARMGSVMVATHNATIALFALLSSFMYGLVAATSVRVSRHLGAGRSQRARATSFYALRVAFLFGAAVALAFVLGRNHIGRVFSSDPEVWEQSSRIMTLTGASYFAMSFFFWAMATLSGQVRLIFPHPSSSSQVKNIIVLRYYFLI